MVSMMHMSSLRPPDPIKKENTVNDQPLCELCHQPMPEGEDMFKYHGYSGPCPAQEEPTRPERAGGGDA